MIMADIPVATPRKSLKKVKSSDVFVPVFQVENAAEDIVSQVKRELIENNLLPNGNVIHESDSIEENENSNFDLQTRCALCTDFIFFKSF